MQPDCNYRCHCPQCEAEFEAREAQRAELEAREAQRARLAFLDGEREDASRRVFAIIALAVIALAPIVLLLDWLLTR